MKYLKKYKVLIMIFIFSFCLMFFCTRSSPLYRFNGWSDINAYFTMGKGLVSNKILYKDLFDHKGPLLYLIYSIGYLISNTTHFGVYIMESIFMSTTLYFVYKIANIFLNKNLSLITISIVPIFLLNINVFDMGGSPEQFMLTFEIISLYSFLKISKFSLYDKKSYFLLGICSAAIILIKFNIIFFIVGLLLYLPFVLLKEKKYKKIFKMFGYFMLGFLIVTLPFVLYFLFTNSFKDFYFAYIKFNSLYANLEFNITGLRTLFYTLVNVKDLNIISFFIAIYGVLVSTFGKKMKNKILNYSIISSYILTLYFTYSSGRCYYYNYLVIFPFVILGIIYILEIINNKKIEYNYVAIISIFAFILSIHYNFNYHYSKIYKIGDTPQKNVADVLRKYKNPTLLQYRIMDLGFYVQSNIIPEKYFYIPNITYEVFPEVYDKQDEYLRKGKIDFIVTWGEIFDSTLPEENYKLIKKYYDLYNYYDYDGDYGIKRYYLYIKKGLEKK